MNRSRPQKTSTKRSSRATSARVVSTKTSDTSRVSQLSALATPQRAASTKAAPNAVRRVNTRASTSRTISSSSKEVTTTAKRNVALADIKARVVSVSNIGKLTHALQLVATAQFRTARRQQEESRVFAQGIQDSWQVNEDAKIDTSEGKEHWIAFATDRSLCGAVNGNLFKNIRPRLEAVHAANRNDFNLSVVGEKGRAGLERANRKYLSNVFTDVGRCKQLTFKQVCMMSNELLKTNPAGGKIFYNHFINTLVNEARSVDYYNAETMVKHSTFADDFENEGDMETFKNFWEFRFAAGNFNYMCENVASEIAARMSAMSTSSKNAEEIAFLLNRFYNRTRQAKITTELIEINSGVQVIAEQEDQ